MKILLDTHILLWALEAPEKLGEQKLGFIKDLSNILYVSAVTIAEISIKVSLGKLTVNSDILEAVDNAGFDFIDFTPKEADVLKNLPFHHKDPFDRMLISQGIVNDYPVITDDPKFTLYDCRVL